MTKRRTSLRRGLASLLAAAMCCGLLTLNASARETDRFEQWPEDVPAGVRDDWKDPELDQTICAELEEILEALAAAAEENAPVEEVGGLLEQAYERLDTLLTNYAFADWSYNRQPQEYEADDDRWYTAANLGSNAFTAAVQLLLSGPYEQVLREELGDRSVDIMLAQPVLGEEQFRLLEEEQALVYEYNLRVAQVESELTYDYHGISYTIDRAWEEYNNDELTQAEYFTICGPLAREANAQIGPIYLKLVEVRNRFAQSLGFDNYAEYAFLHAYSRDYSVAEGMAYCQELLTELAPLVARLNAVDDPDLDPKAGAEAISCSTAEEMTGKVQPHLETISSEIAGLFQYMLENDLMDAEDLDTKLPTAYTSNLPAYGSAYLFLSPDYLEDTISLVHEFGHYTNYCLADDQFFCFDTAEVHSQGLEMLFLALAEELAGEDDAASLRDYWLKNMLNSGIVSGAVLAAFELEAYTRGDMTLDELNQYYGKLNQMAGVSMAYDGIGYGWYQIPHLFASPCYYISYSTSAASALDILLRAEEDFDQAADQYLDLVAQTDVFGYADAVEAAGLTNMMEPGALTALAKGLEEYIAQTIWKVAPFSDLPEEHWAYSDALAAAAGEILVPNADGAFDPGRLLTGEELNAALDKLSESSDGSEAVPLEDAVSREELVLMLYRHAQERRDTSARADLSGYTDGDQISDEARDAMAWAVAKGILTGTSSNTLSPDAPVTRGQAAVVLVRFLAVL